MNILDITDKSVSVAARSITIKNAANKTCGVVRNITHMGDLAPSKLFTLADKFRKNGLDRGLIMKYFDKIVIYEDTPYILVDDYLYGISFKLGEQIVSDLITLERGGIIPLHCARIHWAAARR